MIVFVCFFIYINFLSDGAPFPIDGVIIFYLNGAEKVFANMLVNAVYQVILIININMFSCVGIKKLIDYIIHVFEVPLNSYKVNMITIDTQLGPGVSYPLNSYRSALY